ncbi:MAG: EAL domain-containing protein [Candidatus Competibacteraceae bacterium]
MSEHPAINLLIVDRVPSDIEHIVQTLRNDGFEVEVTHTDQKEEIRSTLAYQPLDLILLRLGDDLPAITKLREMLNEEAEQNIPLIVIVDDEHRQQRKPARLLEEGADNYFYLDDADHLVAVVRKELQHAQSRQREHSFETRFKEGEIRSQALLENIQEAIAYIHEGIHTYANPAYLRLFGYTSKEELANIQLVHMVPPEYRDALKSVLRRSIRSGKAVEPVELLGLRSNGQTLLIYLECAAIRMNDEPCTQIIVRDATRQNNQQNQQQLEKLLKYDDLTGFYSRRFFIESLEIERKGTVLYIVFTDYAAIRHALGFEAVDQFIADAATLMKNLLAPEDAAAHFASGVFAVYVPTNSPSDPLELAEQFRTAVASNSFQIHGKLFTTTCCIGICQPTENQETAIQVLTHADRACEAARQKGGNQVDIYVPPKEDRLKINPQDENIIRLIREALTKNRLSLSYQPIVSFEGAEEGRYKVYLNVVDEAGKLQPMDKMGTVAVRYGLMGALDKWTLIRGLSVLSERQRSGLKPPILFVRISRNSLGDAEFFNWLTKRLKDSQLPSGQLVVEIKEDNAEECFEETKQLRARLREIGCGLALSHFGGKANSDRLLKELVPDYIKLDGSLIERLAKAKDANSRRAMATLTTQAQQLKSRVVAAGVSTAPQMASIWQFGVTLVQGNMVAEASPEMDFDFRQYAS